MHTARTVIYTLIFVILATAVVGVIFAYSGTFNVSAQVKDGALMHWLATTTRRNSIATRAAGVTVPSSLDDPQVILTGFKHYREMCVGCHRSPGKDASEMSKGLNPPPPNFSKWKKMYLSPQKLFWVIKNGIRMTGMPAWGVTHSDEKIWAMVAFVKRLPQMTPAEYKAFDEKAGPEDEEHDHDEGGDDHDHTHTH